MYQLICVQLTEDVIAIKRVCLHVLSEADTARLATVLQENAVLKSEIEILRLKCKNLLEENRRLRQASVNIVSCMP